MIFGNNWNMNKYKIQLIEWEVHYSAVCAENAKKRDLKKTGFTNKTL